MPDSHTPGPALTASILAAVLPAEPLAVDQMSPGEIHPGAYPVESLDGLLVAGLSRRAYVVSAVLADCAADDAAGYRAFKLKIGRGNRWMDRVAGDARDTEVTRSIREASPEDRILVDGRASQSAG